MASVEPTQQAQPFVWIDAFEQSANTQGSYTVWDSERVMDNQQSLPNSQLTVSGIFKMDETILISEEAKLTFTYYPLLADTVKNNQVDIVRPSYYVREANASPFYAQWPLLLPAQLGSQPPTFACHAIGSVMGAGYWGSPFSLVNPAMRNFNDYSTLNILLKPNCSVLAFSDNELSIGATHQGFNPIFDPRVHQAMCYRTQQAAVQGSTADRSAVATVMIDPTRLQIPINYEAVYDVSELGDSEFDPSVCELLMTSLPFGSYHTQAPGILNQAITGQTTPSVDSNNVVTYPPMPSDNSNWWSYLDFAPDFSDPDPYGSYKEGKAICYNRSALNWTLNNDSYTRSICMIYPQYAAANSTVDKPLMLPINNSEDSAFHELQTQAGVYGTGYQPQLGHTILPITPQGRQPIFPGWPVPPYFATYNAPNQEELYGITYSGWLACQDNPQWTPLANYDVNVKNYSNSTTTLAAASQAYFGTLDYGKNCIVRPGTFEAFFNPCPSPFNSPGGQPLRQGPPTASQGFLSFMPSGLCISPRFTCTNRMAFAMEDVNGDGSYVKPLEVTATITIPAGRYDPQQLANTVTLAMNTPDPSGNYPFFRAFNTTKHNVIFVASDYTDDVNTPWASCTQKANRVLPDMVNEKGRCFHAFAPPSDEMMLGADSPACIVTESGLLAFSNMYTQVAPQNIGGGNTQPNTLGVYTCAWPGQRGPEGPPQWGAFGQMDPEDQVIPADPLFVQSSITYPFNQAPFLSWGLMPLLSLQNLENLAAPPNPAPAGWTYSWYGIPPNTPMFNLYNWENPQTEAPQWLNNMFALAPQYGDGLNTTSPANCIVDAIGKMNIINPFGSARIPGTTGLVLKRVGDGSLAQNNLLTLMGFDPLALSKLYEPTLDYIRPVEGVYFNPNYEGGAIYQFDPAAFCYSNQTPWLFKAAPLWYFYSGPNPNVDISEAAQYRQRALRYVSGPNQTPQEVDFFAVSTQAPLLQFPPGLIETTWVPEDRHEGTQSFILAKTATPLSTALKCRFLLANQVPFSATTSDPACNNLSVVDAYAVNLYNQHSWLWEAPEASTVTPYRYTVDGYNQWTTSLAVGVSCDPGLVSAVSLQVGTNSGLGPYTLINFATTRSQTIEGCGVYPIPGSYCLRMPITYDNAYYQSLSVRALVQPTTTKCQVTNWQVANPLNAGTAALCDSALPEIQLNFAQQLIMSVPTYNWTIGNYPTITNWTPYIQGVTDSEVPTFMSLSAPEKVTAWIIPQLPTYQNPDSYVGLNLQAIINAIGKNVVEAGRIHFDQIVSGTVNMSPSFSHMGIWGLPTYQELSSGKFVQPSYLLKRFANPSRVIGVVTNFKMTATSNLCYPFSGANITGSLGLPTSDEITQDVLLPLSITVTDSVDPSQPAAIPSTASNLLLASGEPVVTSSAALSGVVLLRISNMTLSTGVNTTINGAPGSTYIPITITPSPEGWDSVSFTSQMVWTVPQQEVSSIRYQLLTLSRQPLNSVNNVRYVLSFTPTGSATPSDAAFYGQQDMVGMENEMAPELVSTGPASTSAQPRKVGMQGNFTPKRPRASALPAPPISPYTPAMAPTPLGLRNPSQTS